MLSLKGVMWRRKRSYGEFSWNDIGRNVYEKKIGIWIKRFH